MRKTKELDVKKIIICALVAILLIVAISLIWYFVSISKVSKNEQEIEVTIPLGSGTNSSKITSKRFCY